MINVRLAKLLPEVVGEKPAFSTKFAESVVVDILRNIRRALTKNLLNDLTFF